MASVRAEFTYPWTAVPGFRVKGRKFAVIFSHEAVSVVAATNSSGSSVTHTYRIFPALIIAVDATHNATQARS